MQFSFDSFKMYVWFQYSSQMFFFFFVQSEPTTLHMRCRRSLAFVFVFCSRRMMKAGYLLQFIVYGDGSLYSYKE